MLSSSRVASLILVVQLLSDVRGLRRKSRNTRADLGCCKFGGSNVVVIVAPMAADGATDPRGTVRRRAAEFMMLPQAFRSATGTCHPFPRRRLRRGLLRRRSKEARRSSGMASWL